MSREIKFRVWDAFTNEIRPLDNEDVGMVLDGADGLNIMQFTGLKDANDKEIYEGDIIKLFNSEYEIFEVMYDNDCAAYVIDSDNGFGDWFDKKDREIIGNIFENAELLK